MSDKMDWPDAEDELCPMGHPHELVHHALTSNGAWGLGVRDALGMRECMDPEKPPAGDSSWLQDVDLLEKVLAQVTRYEPYLQGLARRVAWAAYRQGLFHGEMLERERLCGNDFGCIK